VTWPSKPGRSWPVSGSGSAKPCWSPTARPLHHLLPDLIPPIDRTYTLKFFLGRPYLYPGRDADYFRVLYPLFQEIAVRCSGEIHQFIATPSEGMNTSVTKIIDNAILGFMPTQPADP
jgi:hypothetical protein